MTHIEHHDVEVEGIRLHYRAAGDGPPVLLLHGWPTSSFLWRDTLPPLAKSRRAIALDLPGFGASAKPLDASYSFRFYDRILTGFLDALGFPSVGLAVHDLGGPVGLYWALHHQERVNALALLNTLVYPRLSWAVVAFVAASYTPGLRSYITSPEGLAFAMRTGIHDKTKVTEELLRAVQEPFAEDAARRVLLKSAHSLHFGGMREIAKRLPSYRGPVRILYGANDRILPDVARTMARVARDLPQAEATCLADCGHFLQEERGEEIGALLEAFFAKHDAA